MCGAILTVFLSLKVILTMLKSWVGAGDEAILSYFRLKCITGLVPKCSFTASTERGQGLPIVYNHLFTSQCLLRQTSLLLHVPCLSSCSCTSSRAVTEHSHSSTFSKKVGESRSGSGKTKFTGVPGVMT